MPMMPPGVKPLLLLMCLLFGQEPATSGPYKGWDNALTMKAQEVTLVAVPAVAGRIVQFAHKGENILFENPDYLGKTLANTAPNSIAQGYIGYTVDIGPELRKIPRHLSLWMGPTTTTSEQQSVTLTSGEELGLKLSKELRFDPQTGSLRVLQKLKNVSGQDQSYCLWDRTLCVGGGFAIVRLNPKSRFKAGWSLLRKESYDGDTPDHPNVTIKDGVLVVDTKGTWAKLGADTDCGWVAYVRGRLLFVKRFPYAADGRYTDGGNSVEIYFDPKVCELEPLSPEVALKPGQEYAFPETWTLTILERDITTAEEARSLVDRISAR